MSESTSSDGDSEGPSTLKARLHQRFADLRGRGRAWREGLRTDAGKLNFAIALALVVVVAGGIHRLYGPMFDDPKGYGVHDWDAASSYRYITVVAAHYFEAPWWTPFACGGVPAWGYAEGATNFVSPYFPVYLSFGVQLAERFEIVGQTLLGFVGTYLLAGRFTRSTAARSLVAILYVLNGRWTMQAVVGHTWHLQYALIPLAFYYFDIALEPGRLRHAFGAGFCLALMVYWGGVYPMPHAVLALGIYACLMAAFTRKLRPFFALAITGGSAFGFSAPKLLAIADFMSHYSRKVRSDEAVGPVELWSFFTDPTQSISHAPFNNPAWGWHEYGAYIGYGGVAVLLVGLFLGIERRALAFKFMGLLYMLLSLGEFHRYAPWTLLHKLPVFSSQHVPSRALEPAILFLSIAFASFFGRRLDATIQRLRWLDLAFFIPVVFVLTDIVANGTLNTTHSFTKKMTPITRSATFHHQRLPDAGYVPSDWEGQTIPAMRENVGTLKCYGHDTLEIGAVAKGSPGYHGEAFFPEGAGRAAVSEWSPNGAVVEYDGAKPGDLLVYNMNYDASWKANGESVVNVDNRIGIRVTSDHGRLTLRYFPRTLKFGVALVFLTLIGAFWPKLRELWRRVHTKAALATG